MGLDHDGIDDQVDHGDIAAIDGATKLTGMIWVWIDTLELEGAFFSKVNFGANTASLFFGMDTADNSKIAFATAYSVINGFRSATGIVTAGSWIHFAFVYDGTQVAQADRTRFFKNGVLTADTPVGTIPAALSSNTDPLRTGAGEIGGTTTIYTDGKFAHLRMWADALTDAEIAQEMNSDRPVRTADLILSSPYDDGTSARDYSGSGNHGTVTGALQIAGPPVSGGARVLVGSYS